MTGVDLSPEMLERARARFAGDAQVRFIAGSAERLDVPDQSFDVVVCNNAFHLVQDAPAALREFHRVLRPADRSGGAGGGRVIIVDWCKDYPQILLMNMFFRMTDRQARTIRTVEALSRLLVEAGFTIFSGERFRVPPLWGMMAIAAEKASAGPQALAKEART